MKNLIAENFFMGSVFFGMMLIPNVIWAGELSSGDTAWMLTSTCLVLFMTIPGLALFYGGLVRSKNVLSILMQCFTMAALMSILWVLYGYSLAFDTVGMSAGATNINSFIGGLNKAFLFGVESGSLVGTIPETVFITFQMTFAIITPSLIVGAFAERMKFSSMVLFSALWFTMVYLPICHMAWAGDGSFFGEMGALDFAGGTVVHINSGVAALVAALMIGKRKGYPSKPIPPHSLTITVVGASMLWVGWFGFNAGSALAADEAAGMAMLVTQVASAAAALTWMAVEWVKHGKASVLGIVTGAVAGLVAITPASGSVGPFGAIIIGFATGLICYYAVTKIKARYGYDDALDVFGVHGVGGIVGALLTAIFVSDTFGGSGLAEGMTIFSQFMAQLKSVVFTFVYSGVLSFILLKLVSMLTGGLRVSEEEEYQGLDITLHNEQGYYQEN